MINLRFDISFLRAVQEDFATKGIHIVIVLCIGMGTYFRFKKDKSELGEIADTSVTVRQDEEFDDEEGDDEEGGDEEFDDEEFDTSEWHPDPHQMYKVKKDKTLSQVLNFLDEEYGLDTPIFVFGYMAIGRGISVRSNNRVLTHLQVGLGCGQ